MYQNKFRKPRQDGEPHYGKASCCLWQPSDYSRFLEFVKYYFLFFFSYGKSGESLPRFSPSRHILWYVRKKLSHILCFDRLCTEYVLYCSR